MGHQNTVKPAPPPDYTAAKAPSATQTALQDSALKTINWANKGDYTNPREGGLFTNYADPAMLHRHSELIANEAGQGIEGIGVADPNYLATVKQNQAAHQDEANAAQYESDIKSGVGAATGVAGQMANLDEQTKNAILSAQTGLYNTTLNKTLGQPAWWKELLLGGASAAGPAAIAAI